MAVENFKSFNQDKLIDCLTKQLSELELFQTMYSPRELIITNTEVIEGIHDVIAKKTMYVPNHLDYTITQHVEKLKLEISIHLPSMYPEVSPEVYVRCNQLNRHQEKSVNTDLTAYLESKYDGEVCIYTAILWLQENADRYTIKIPVRSNTSSTTQQKFCRYWIYSHHIYSKKKTEDIIKVSKELHLNGFCLLGKPGVICVEGNEEDCKDWWKIVKSLHWQKIALRITEIFNPNERIKQTKFQNFDIISFRAATGHTDLGSFQNYMLKYGLADQLNEFFGVHTS